MSFQKRKLYKIISWIKLLMINSPVRLNKELSNSMPVLVSMSFGKFLTILNFFLSAV